MKFSLTNDSLLQNRENIKYILTFDAKNAILKVHRTENGGLFTLINAEKKYSMVDRLNDL